ncbi:hypothetical protein QE152_g22033 [Popillia japonica]|uniref:PiggyBac transposable element-derived protein domain-containing protein n=1 Tax=Popillia japonica TaxID=7064 RepID=A0AAW1KND7_POPJA
MAEYGIRFERGFSLHEALAMLEEGDELVENVDSVTIFPPNNACADQTDEDSGEEDSTNLNNLPGTQLQAPAEINLRNIDDQDPNQTSDDDFSSDDEIPLSVLRTKKARAEKIKTKRKNYKWTGTDLEPDNTIFSGQTDEQDNRKSPLELFSLFFDDEILDMIVNENNTKIETSDKFAKVRPLFQHLNKKYLEHSLCEEMHSLMKPWCHTLVVMAVNNLYMANPSVTDINYGTKYSGYGVGPAVVLEYADVLKKKWPNVQMHLFFDNFFSTLPLLDLLSNNNLRGTGTIRENFFSTLPLLDLLSNNNLRGTGTIRENRIPASPLMDSKRMKKQPRGSYDYRKVDGENIIKKIIQCALENVTSYRKRNRLTIFKMDSKGEKSADNDPAAFGLRRKDIFALMKNNLNRGAASAYMETEKFMSENLYDLVNYRMTQNLQSAHYCPDLMKSGSKLRDTKTDFSTNFPHGSVCLSPLKKSKKLQYSPAAWVGLI